MDIKYLNTFRVIVEEGSFSSAANRLNYTQSTITFQIAQLEQELNTKLFEKLGRRMVLTKAGEQLIPYVNNVLDSVNQMRNFENDLKECRGDLHIGVGETLLCFQLPKILKEFHRMAPKARLFIRSMNCYDMKMLAGSAPICKSTPSVISKRFWSLRLTQRNVTLTLSHRIVKFHFHLLLTNLTASFAKCMRNICASIPFSWTTQLSYGVFQQ